MKTRWLGDIKDPEQKERTRVEIVSAVGAFERLTELLTEDLENCIKEAASKTSFENASWSEYQAYLLGRQNALRSVIELIDLGE